MLKNIFKAVLGDPNQREIKKLTPLVDEVRALEAEMKAKSDDELRQMLADFRRQLAEDIFLGIAGATLQARQGDVQNARGSSQVHRNTADLFIWHLSMAAQHVLNDRRNGLVRDIIDLNRVVEEYPKATLAAVDEQDLVAELSVDTGLWEIGVKQSLSALYERYNREPPDPNDPDDSLGGKADQEAQVAAATIAAPAGGPGVEAAADRVLTDHTKANMGTQEMTSPAPAGMLPGVPMAEKLKGGTDQTGIDAPIHTGAGVDSIGRKYGMAAGKWVSLKHRAKRYDEEPGRNPAAYPDPQRMEVMTPALAPEPAGHSQRLEATGPAVPPVDVARLQGTVPADTPRAVDVRRDDVVRHNAPPQVGTPVLEDT